ncbi:MAG: hypothetical protein IJ088_03685 [Clostridia bacterium]|nr:hypothetical protein [Clostridia bacterium]
MKIPFVSEPESANVPRQKLNQPGSEIPFPSTFASVPRRHHVMIVHIEKAWFYIQKTQKRGWSRRAPDDNIRSDLLSCFGRRNDKEGNAVIHIHLAGTNINIPLCTRMS